MNAETSQEKSPAVAQSTSPQPSRGKSQAYWQARDARQTATDNTPRPALGLTSFNAEDQHRFGRNVRLAMALMEDPTAGPALTPEQRATLKQAFPEDPGAIAVRLRSLCKDRTAMLADQLELLVRFDEKQGWKSSGATQCCDWMNRELGIGRTLGWEYLRVGRELRALPILRALFRDGRLSWSKIRILCRVATVDNEALLSHAALDASVAEVDRMCASYRWADAANEDPNNSTDGSDDAAHDHENRLALQQFDARAFTWRTASNGNTEFRLSLPPDRAEAFLASIEQSLARLNQDTTPTQHTQNDAIASETTGETTSGNTTSDTMAQKRADAAVLMAETALQAAGREIATADRFQVVINVDANELGTARRATLQGDNPIARETARRHACDCSVSTVTMSDHGEPLDIGRKSRIWPAAMARAIKARDHHCQFPGCTATRHLQIHHIAHWADGGSTCVDNGVCLCSKHHTFVHEGGYRIERVSDVAGATEQQFRRQQHAPPGASAEETVLRQSRASFDQVRKQLPDRFRFRVVNRHLIDLLDIGESANSATTPTPARTTSGIHGPGHAR